MLHTQVCVCQQTYLYVSGSRVKIDGVVDLRTHLKKALRKRWAEASDDQKKEAASHAVQAYWAQLTPEERSTEMKRRAAVRAKNRARKTKPR